MLTSIATVSSAMSDSRRRRSSITLAGTKLGSATDALPALAVDGSDDAVRARSLPGAMIDIMRRNRLVGQ